MKPSEAIAVLVASIGAVSLFAVLAYNLGEVIQHPVKSDRQLCEERGGVYINARSGAVLPFQGRV